MTFIPKEAIEVIAQSIGITNLSPDVALAVAPDVEYRMREIMQEAVKCMRHARRTVLRAEDVDRALKLRNVEAINGFGSSDSLRFKRADGLKDLYYIDDKDVDFKDVLAAPLPKAPIETSVTTHWLAIEGVQLAIPENAPVEGSLLLSLSIFLFYGQVDCSILYYTLFAAPAAVSDGKRSDYREDGLSADIKLPVKHVLSRELQFYFDKIKQLTVNRSNSILFRQSLTSLATSSGIQPLVPFFTYFIADEVTRSLTNFPLLFALMRVARSLLQNPHLHIELYVSDVTLSVHNTVSEKSLERLQKK
ncbi:hypothetical protein Pint_04032 [Pistacia integerrima]|uniref:Uncharacterized protein n=2 Tax=Pistacia TaxID=55512 RepID=A0ACC1BT65_9ROSI|nr:hypothetical protein Pint_04032 [Pistacia integerrima]KAJ0102144.1 hypothetical protein Patl1_04094 [Pistacia atlantica]